jgi:2',3'-cyclic-nucleotide 2'-phosphodiesterase
MKILCMGDVFGSKGVRYAAKHIREVCLKEKIDLVIANIENSDINGKGPSVGAIETLGDAGANVFTGGNHSFANRSFYAKYSVYSNCIRPLNFPSGAPGRGYYVVEINEELVVAVLNVQLRVFMLELVDCPIRTTESVMSLIKSIYKGKKICFVIDLHGEATAEKAIFANYFDGKVSVIFGTHTHIQTADERVLPRGTGYITDVGMTGALNSSLGASFDSLTYRMLYQMPRKMIVEEAGPYVSCGVIFELDSLLKVAAINRVKKIYY